MRTQLVESFAYALELVSGGARALTNCLGALVYATTGVAHALALYVHTALLVLTASSVRLSTLFVNVVNSVCQQSRA
jgi:hypothetical protein